MATIALPHRQRPEDYSARSHPDNMRPASFTYLRSSLTPRPRLPPRPQTRPSKPKGLPMLGERLGSDLSANEKPVDLMTSSVTTPYRLPKLNSDGQAPEENEVHKVWSRHGYDVYSAKPIELHVLASQLETSPRVLTQEMRRSHLAAAYPEFAAAVISPIKSQQKFYAGPDPAFYRGIVTRPPTRNVDDVERVCDANSTQALDTGPTPSPMPFTRSSSPAKSGKSIHWALTQYRNIHVDKKGRNKTQGPYSREFTVTCSAPNNWLRMKFTRSKTVI